MNKTCEPNNCDSMICEMVAGNWTKMLKKTGAGLTNSRAHYACNHLYFSTL